MPTERGVIKLTIDGTNYVDFSDIASGNWATADEVYSGKYFVDSSGNCIPGTAGRPQEKRDSAKVDEDVVVLPDAGHVLSKVIINAIKAEQPNNITPNDSTQTINPSEGYNFLSKVVVNPVPVKEIETTPKLDGETFDNSDGNYISKVTIAPIPTKVVETSPKSDEQTFDSSDGVYISNVTIAPVLTEEAEVQSEIRTVAEGSEITPTEGAEITPTEGKYFSKVTIQPIIGRAAKITPIQEEQTLLPEPGECYSEIKVFAIQAEECNLDPLKTDIWEATPEEGQYYTKVTITKIPRYSGKMEVR